MIKYFKKMFIQNQELSRFQEDVADTFNQILKNPIQDYVILKDVVLGTTSTFVDHKLGRMPIGWFIVNKNANANVWNYETTDKYLDLDASAAVTVDIYVF